MEAIVSGISNALYNYILIILLVLGGLYFTVRTKCVQFRLFGSQLKSVTEKSRDGKVAFFQALMVIINVPVICVLGKYAFRALKNYDQQRKAGKDPVFVAKDIGIDDQLDFWQE